MKKSILAVMVVCCFGCQASELETSEAIRELRGDVEKINENLDKLIKSTEEIKASLKQEETDSVEKVSDEKKETTKISPADAKKIIDKAASLIEENSSEEAKKLLEDFIRNHSDNLYVGQAYFYGGMIAFSAANYKKSAQYFLKSLKSNPQGAKAPNALYHLGLSLEKMEKQKEAKEVFSKVVEQYPGEFADKAKKKLANLK